MRERYGGRVGHGVWGKERVVGTADVARVGGCVVWRRVGGIGCNVWRAGGGGVGLPHTLPTPRRPPCPAPHAPHTLHTPHLCGMGCRAQGRAGV